MCEADIPAPRWGPYARPMRRTVLFVAVLLALSACALGDIFNAGPDNRADMTPGDLVGVWQDSATTHTIEFTAEGEFYADDIAYLFVGSAYLPAGFDPQRDRAPGSGAWSLDRSLAEPGGPHSIIGLQFDVLARRPTLTAGGGLAAETYSDGLHVSHYGSYGNSVIYRRCGQCAHVAPDHIALGTWVEATAPQLMGAWRDQAGGTLTFAADGTFIATDIAYMYAGATAYLPAGLDPRLGPIPGHGTWQLVSPPADPGRPAAVRIVFDTVSGRRTFFVGRQLTAYQVGGALTLVSATTDPSILERRVYHRAR